MTLVLTDTFQKALARLDRVNQDIRVIVNQQGADTVLCYVAHHDPAYAWAQRHTFEPNSVTGAAQMRRATSGENRLATPVT